MSPPGRSRRATWEEPEGPAAARLPLPGGADPARVPGSGHGTRGETPARTPRGAGPVGPGTPRRHHDRSGEDEPVRLRVAPHAPGQGDDRPDAPRAHEP